MDSHKGVIVYCELSGKNLTEISTEMLGCGRRLADRLGEELGTVILGCGIKETAREAIAYGAAKVYVVDNPSLECYQTDSYVSVMERLVKKTMPKILILGQTSIGRDLAPSLAFRLDSAATLDCVDLAIDPDSGRLLQTKPVYGGNARAVFMTESNPQIATVRAKAMAPFEPDSTRQGEVVAFDAAMDPQGIRTKLKERFPEKTEGIRLEDAKVVVGGGRGIGGAEGFGRLKDLASMLMGAVGATRAACDNGWMPPTNQIGLTGKVINPDLYIAIALSGASQHMAGCYGARNIVAINKDDGANIFREARYGVVGDWKEVLPGLIDKLKELKVKGA
jgi:electron transfer flavoprotein alpha subunit